MHPSTREVKHKFLEHNLWDIALYKICKFEDERENAISFSIPF